MRIIKLIRKGDALPKSMGGGKSLVNFKITLADDGLFLMTIISDEEVRRIATTYRKVAP